MSEEKDLEASILGRISAEEENLVRAAQDLETVGKQNKKIGVTKKTKKTPATKRKTSAKAQSTARSATGKGLTENKNKTAAKQGTPSVKRKQEVLPLEDEGAVSPTKLPTSFSNDTGKVLCVGVGYDKSEDGAVSAAPGKKSKTSKTVKANAAATAAKEKKPKTAKTKKDTILGFELDEIPDGDAEILDAEANPEYEPYEIPDYSYNLNNSQKKKLGKSGKSKKKTLSSKASEASEGQLHTGIKKQAGKRTPNFTEYLGGEVVTQENTVVSKIFQGLFMVSIPIIILWVSFRLVASSFFTALEFLRMGPVEGLDSGTRQRFADYTLGYLFSNADRSYLEDLKLKEKPAFTSDEISHMSDVRDLVSSATYLMFFAIALTVVSIIVLSISDRQALLSNRTGGAIKRAFFCGALITLSLVVLAVPLMLLNWQGFFNGFHESFFPQGNWQFGSKSLLIKLFPEQFWYDAATVMAALVVLASLLTALSNWPKRKERIGKAVAKGLNPTRTKGLYPGGKPHM